MNRSLEALAILVICLVGILAAVRISTKDRSSSDRAAARAPAAAPKSASPAGSSSSAQGSVPPELVYDDSCGLDRATGQVYRPLTPLLSPSALAARLIRSEPLPLIVLPEAEAAEESTGYDAAYDAVMFDGVVAEELDYLQAEAEYAEAELAAAFDASDEEAFFLSTRDSLTRGVAALAPWLTEQVKGVGVEVVANIKHYDRAYAPLIGAARTKWAEHVAPRLRLFPRSPKTARKNLLNRQQASALTTPPVSWEQYEEFADRELGPRSEVAAVPRLGEQQSSNWLRSPAALLAEACEVAERVLHGAGEQLQRVARQPEDDEIWRTR